MRAVLLLLDVGQTVIVGVGVLVLVGVRVALGVVLVEVVESVAVRIVVRSLLKVAKVLHLPGVWQTVVVGVGLARPVALDEPLVLER